MKYNIKNTKLKLVTLLLASSFGVLQSCDDLVNESPISASDPNNFFQDNQQLRSGLIAAYDGLQESYATHYLRWGEFRSDNVSPSPAATDVLSLSVHNSSMDPGATSILRWNELYQCIDRANRVINGAANIVSPDRNVLAQALAIRAKVYFDMTRVWGDIPVFTEAVTTPEDAFVSVTPSETIMNDIVIPDMLRANELILTNSSEFEFSKSSVLALIAEVYMSLNTPATTQLAKDAMLELVALGEHSLVTTPEDWQNLFINQPSTNAFPEGPGKVQRGPELIFSIKYNPPIDFTPSTVFPRYAGGAKNTVIEESLEELWTERFPIDTLWDELYPDTPPVFTREVLVDDVMVEEPVYGDWRYFASREEGDFEAGVGSVEVGNARIHKWQKNRTGLVNNLDATDLVLYRYADIILLLAEAELKLGNVGPALDLVNEIRTARQLPLVTMVDFGASTDDQLEYILTERRFELLGEGKRWWDLVRNDLVEETMNPIISDRLGADATLITPDRIFWPILSEHLIDNPNLSQNQGW